VVPLKDLKDAAISRNPKEMCEMKGSKGLIFIIRSGGGINDPNISEPRTAH